MADHIIILEDGIISEQGSYSILSTAGGYTQTLVKGRQQHKSSSSSEAADDKGENVTADEETKAVIAKARKQYQMKEEAKNTDKRRQLGDRSVYKYYFGSIGMTYALTLVGLEFGWAFLEAFPSKFTSTAFLISRLTNHGFE